MFKTFLRVATTFGVLLACYAAYVHVFAILAGGLHPPGGEGERAAPRQIAQSKHLKEAMRLSEIAFGPEHWTVREKQIFRIYNADRGFWMYFREYERLKDGKQVRFTPFALISAARGAQSMKIATSRSALVDLDKPFDMMIRPSGDGNIKILHARLEGEVVLRDNKGTAAPRDDTVITGLTYIDYDDASLKIVGDDLDTVVIDDPLYRVVGKGLEIQLRPKEDGLPSTGTTTGFDGPQSMILKRDPRVTIRDVGPSGVLPGNPSAVRNKEKTPLDVRGDGMMLIRLPKPKIQPVIGPPAPADPTYAWFNRNVEVVRGKAGTPTDTLNCDKLFLTLVPEDKSAPKPGAPAPAAKKADPADPDAEAASTSALGGLTLRRAEATGPNVWLVSAAQGMKARCLELIHEKRMPDAPDKTYLRGNASSKLIVWKTDIAQDGPEKGHVTSFTTIHTIDATIFDEGQGNDHVAIVARGPGDMDTRPGLDKPVIRKAHWLDQLTWQSEYLPGKPGAAPTPSGKRILILTGDPGFTDIPAQSQLDAHDRITVYLKPKAVVASKPAGEADKTKDPAVGSASFEIERLYAKTNVRLNAPNKTLIARDWLNAEFEPRPAAKPEAGTGAAKAPQTATGPKVSAVAATTPTPAPGVGSSPAKPEPAKSNEPPAKASADRVYAKILLSPSTPPKIDAKDAGPGAGAGDPDKPPGGASLINGDNQRAEVDTALLRGSVVFHQDAPPGKPRGTDVAGEAVDIHNQGEGRQKFIVYHHDPQKPRVKAADQPEPPLARVDTDEFTFRGEELMIDQAHDEAEIKSRGSITMLAASGLLSDKGLDGTPKPTPKPAPAAAKPANKNANAKPSAAPAKKTPMYIEFTRGMLFHGRPVDRPGFLVARAEFRGTVHGETDESTFDCTEIMTVYFDRNIALVQQKAPERAPEKPGPAPEEPKPQIALIDMVKDVVVFNEKLDPETEEVLQRQRIEGDRLIYDKRTGDFFMPEQSGIVYLYERDGGNSTFAPGDDAAAKDKAARAARIEPRTRRIVRTSGPVQPARRPAEVVGRNTERKPADRKPDPKKPAARKPLPPLVLTQVRFTRQMNGRFGTGKDSDKTEPRRADFHGDVEVMRGPVDDADTIFDYDNRPATAQFITSQILRVVSEPSKTDPSVSPRYLMSAWENANAITEDKIIQADRLTYDSATNLFYAYGDEGKDILIAQQGQPGQPASVAPGQAMWYNAKTGQSQLLDPRSLFFIDSRTGQRPKLVKPPDDKVKPRNPKRTQFRNLKGSLERQGFGSNTGR